MICLDESENESSGARGHISYRRPNISLMVQHTYRHIIWILNYLLSRLQNQNAAYQLHHDTLVNGRRSEHR